MLSLFQFIFVSITNSFPFQYLTVISSFVFNGTLLSEGQKWNTRKAAGLCVICNMFLIMIISSDSAAQRGLWPPRPRDCLITHDVPHSVGLLWTSDPLVAATAT
jgi:hypothetical protein